ncbi:MAG: tRNA (N6-threonylcarbamoyladenosine(37)-N6)-methyltransferase TrmO [Deltaproteobacteria bacterium]
MASQRPIHIEYRPIGIIHSPFESLEGMPIQPAGAQGVEGTVDIFDAFRPGLKDLDGFSHIILLYSFHKSAGYELEVIPFLDTVPRGVFATRAPKRPNPIGVSVVALKRMENGVLHIENVDILDGTPLLDVKPYIPEFDHADHVKTGWLGQSRQDVSRKQSDNRFK